MMTDAKFWDRIAPKYARNPIKNMTAYEATLARVKARLSSSDSVLEIGCGTGSTALLLAPHVARYTGADVSPGMIEIARGKLPDSKLTNLNFTVAPTVETRFEPESYDAILGFNILHLVEDLPQTLDRAFKLLKPGGLFITKTPCLGAMNPLIRLAIPVMQAFGKAPYVGVFKQPALEDMIRNAGFDLTETRAFDRAPTSWFVVAVKP